MGTEAHWPIMAIIILGSLAAAVWLGYVRGLIAGERKAREFVATHLGCAVEAKVKLGGDLKYGVQVGQYFEGPDHDLKTDWITSGQDRMKLRSEALLLVRRYWPHAVITEEYDIDHPLYRRDTPSEGS